MELKFELDTALTVKCISAVASAIGFTKVSIALKRSLDSTYLHTYAVVMPDVVGETDPKPSGEITVGPMDTKPDTPVRPALQRPGFQATMHPQL
jgi:hypothetical protein